ncbi:MAG: aminoacyl-tRNA hydrolase [Clostridiaceae bacterium]|jgi:peptidyl-tRNA hydrolase, PTH1 family|nr:aminoacyl-tRNA hydrolase [Clostridiaceae bacterium]
MKLIVALGNIGEKYCFTRHNIGFMTADKLALDKGLSFKEEKKLKCFLTKFKQNDEDIMIIKPTTYMNLSGEATIAVMNYYKIDIKDVIVIYDDLTIPLGKMRFRKDGSDGGHNGIKSIIQCLNSKDFARIKLGTGPQPAIPSEVFVLQNFSKEQLIVVKDIIKKAGDAVLFYFENGIEKTQNKFN